jgi:carboxypeptidase C (cathepsin A)
MKPLAALLVALGVAALPLSAAWSDEPADKPSATAKGDADKKDVVPEAKVWVTRHQIRIGDGRIAYTATAGTVLIKNDKDEPIALFGFTAYVKDGADPRTRPILFAYNGGPGSASAWLHMGILGPKRTVLKDLDANTRGPFQSV